MDSFPTLASSMATETASAAPRRIPSRQQSRGTAVSVAPTRERILSAAAQLFAEHGFASTSMPAIAELSGITAGAIYRHFASKAELLLEVVKRALEALPFSFERASEKDDAALLPDVAARFTDPALTLLRQLALEVHAAARRDPEVSKLLSAYNEMVMERIRALIESAPPAKAHDATRGSEFTARALMVFLMGLHHMDTLHPHLVGDRAWREFVASHVATLLGLNSLVVRRRPRSEYGNGAGRQPSRKRRERAGQGND
jgi:AcrR family transcriptional regulator